MRSNYLLAFSFIRWSGMNRGTSGNRSLQITHTESLIRILQRNSDILFLNRVRSSGYKHKPNVIISKYQQLKLQLSLQRLPQRTSKWPNSKPHGTTTQQTIAEHLLNDLPIWFLVLFLLERPNLFEICNNTFSKWWEGWRMACRRVLSSTPASKGFGNRWRQRGIETYKLELIN
jgi:hypothetical protein